LARELQKEATCSGWKLRSPSRTRPGRRASFWKLENVKITKKGSGSYFYGMATWRESSKTRNVQQGSCGKMNAEEALQKSLQEKARALGIRAN